VIVKTKARKPEIVRIAPDEYESGCENLRRMAKPTRL
jgi:hypothetical protein